MKIASGNLFQKQISDGTLLIKHRTVIKRISKIYVSLWDYGEEMISFQEKLKPLRKNVLNLNDTFLFANVFENFRKMSLGIYKLCPSKFVSVPG